MKRVKNGDYWYRVVPVDPEKFKRNYSDAFWRASEANAGMLNVVLDQARRVANHDCLVAVISDFDGFDDTSRRHLRRLASCPEIGMVLRVA